MGFLNTNSTPRLVEKLADGDNIKIAGNSKGNRVGTVIKKIVEKADDVTKAIEQEVVNDGYSFKVGTGNVDVSADVEDGFGEVGVKGVTYQNLLGTLVTVGKEWVESDNKYTLNLPSGSGQPQIRYNLAYPLKSNAKYTLICEIKEYTAGYPHFCFMTKDNTTLASTTEFTSNSVGIKTEILTTKSDVNAELLRILPRSNTDNIYSIGKNIILLEGDHTNNPNLPSYFEGIVGVGDKSKNLFNKSTITPNKTVNSSNGILNENDSASCSDFIPVDANTKYTISGRSASVGAYYTNDYSHIGSFSGQSLTTPSNCKNIRFNFLNSDNVDGIQLEKGTVATTYEPHHDGHKIEILSSGKNIFDKSTIADNSYIDVNGDAVSYNGWFSSDFIRVHKGEKYYIYNEKHREPFAGLYSYYYDVNKNKIESLNLGDVELVGIKEFVSKYDGYIRISGITRHIEKGKFYTNSDRTQILLDEPLMRLPNGVCDEITRDGKLIRRVGKYVFDGSFEIYPSNTIESGKYRWCIWKDSSVKNVGSREITVICDKYESATAGATWEAKRGISQNSTGNVIYLYADEYSDASSESNRALKQWLSQNPVTVYYELSTPIVTELPAPYLRIFKDGHLTFNTLVAPESNHVVQLNKSAQIERSIREVQSLDSRVGKLESFYDDMMLETSHKLNLLTYDFEYTKESEDI